MDAATRPDKTAIVMAGSGNRVTYGELNARPIQLARLLAARGLRRGDTVALLAENEARYLEVNWAAMRSRLYFTAVNWHRAPGEPPTR
jgi:acyl-CoA synthetase (AMP-forming)/AMP-acid ligase II